MSRSSSRLTSGRSRTPRTRLNIAALAPIPSANVRTTVTVRPFARARERAPTFSSRRKDTMFSIMRLPLFEAESCKSIAYSYCDTNKGRRLSREMRLVSDLGIHASRNGTNAARHFAWRTLQHMRAAAARHQSRKPYRSPWGRRFRLPGQAERPAPRRSQNDQVTGWVSGERAAATCRSPFRGASPSPTSPAFRSAPASCGTCASSRPPLRRGAAPRCTAPCAASWDAPRWWPAGSAARSPSAGPRS